MGVMAEGVFQMKNTIKVFGTYSRILCAIALIAVLGLSMTGCPEPAASSGGGGNSGGSSDRYTLYTLVSKDYASTFTATFGGTPPTAGEIAFGTKSKEELKAACEADSSNGKATNVRWEEGIKIALRNDHIQGITTAQITQVEDKIQTDGYAVVGRRSDNNSKTSVYGFFKE